MIKFLHIYVKICLQKLYQKLHFLSIQNKNLCFLLIISKNKVIYAGIFLKFLSIIILRGDVIAEKI